MKYFEVSKRIELDKKPSKQALKQALLDRLQRAFIVSDLSESDQSFEVQITTGSRKSLIKSATAKVHVDVLQTDKKASFVVRGEARLSLSLGVWYTLLFFVILILGLLPGSLETSAATSGAMDVLVFLIFGIFTMYDVDKKMSAVREMVVDALASVEVEFG